jgi:hypothetical protein
MLTIYESSVLEIIITLYYVIYLFILYAIQYFEKLLSMYIAWGWFYEPKLIANYTTNKLILHKRCEWDFDKCCVVTGNKEKYIV